MIKVVEEVDVTRVFGDNVTEYKLGLHSNDSIGK
jgi:hypothetical protein